MMYTYETIIKVPGQILIKDITHKTIESATAQVEAAKKIHGDKGTYLIRTIPIRKEGTNASTNGNQNSKN